MSTNTPEALRLGLWLLRRGYSESCYSNIEYLEAAEELKRLHSENERLRQIIAYQGMDDTSAHMPKQADTDPNAPWLTEAHMLCTDYGIAHGDITGRLKALREKLQGMDDTADIPAILKRQAT